MNKQTNNTHKFIATSEQINEMLDYYRGYLTYNASNYIIARAKLTNATITFYRTNVVLFQGSGEANEYNHWAEKYNLEVAEASSTLTPLNSLPSFVTTTAATGKLEYGA